MCDIELSKTFSLRFPHYHHNAGATAADTLGGVSGIMTPAGDWPVNTNGKRGKVRNAAAERKDTVFLLLAKSVKVFSAFSGRTQ